VTFGSDGFTFLLVADRNEALRYGDVLAGTKALSARIAAATTPKPGRSSRSGPPTTTAAVTRPVTHGSTSPLWFGFRRDSLLSCHPSGQPAPGTRAGSVRARPRTGWRSS
jgi:hypothetical protein